MSQLSFISDEELEKAVEHLLKVAGKAKVDVAKDINSNVVDPFSILFQMSGFNISSGTWKIGEMNRQAEKTLQNHVGEFHQKILGSVSGWNNLGVGQIVDLESFDKKVIAEIKNKHNTVTGGKLAGLYQDLESQVMPKNSKYKDYTAYYVMIIPKKPIRFNEKFTPPNKSTGSRCSDNNLIRKIDGSSFYTMVTGENDALSQLFDILPDVIEKICKDTTQYKFDDRKFARSFFDTAFTEN
jgi:Eco47II restriction endonuclease